MYFNILAYSEGKAHMCGHDGHTAILLGACKLINEHKSQIPSNATVRLFFQPAEEGPGGAVTMIEEGCLDDVDEVYGIHNFPCPINTVQVKSGPVMGHSSRFHITIHGKGGHASVPHVCLEDYLY